MPVITENTAYPQLLNYDIFVLKYTTKTTIFKSFIVHKYFYIIIILSLYMFDFF